VYYGVKGDMRVKKEKIEIGYEVTGQSYLSDTRPLVLRYTATLQAEAWYTTAAPAIECRPHCTSYPLLELPATRATTL
jgi:hypothetical protein